jgi:transcriptional regulator with PAS, ATPase and Fis domain
MKLRESRNEVEDLKKTQEQLHKQLSGSFHNLIGQSPSIKKVFETIERVANTDANVLILGENGTGKELVASAIHKSSTRRDKPFVSVDLGSISETLFESELFGHVKGAFTDARDSREGRFESANNGTLFLDEIGNLSIPLQAKLLAAIQNRKITRVGSNKEIKVDIRLICATNMPIYDMVRDNQFRQDLLYRINTIEIQIPPLSERIEDIPLLASHFLQVYGSRYNKTIHKISDSVLTRMTKYNWPGNVRELQHVIERAVIMSASSVLQPEDFSFTNTQEREEDNIMLDKFHLEEVEKILIRKVLKKFNGNITLAANELGLTRSSLYRRLEKYGI